MTVTPRSEKSLLRDHHIVPEHYRILIVDPDSFSDPRSLTDRQIPGKTHSNSRAHHNTSADTGAEYTKDGDSKPGAWLPGIGHEEQLKGGP